MGKGISSARRPCAIVGCGDVAGMPGTAKGMCYTHYGRLRRNGDPLVVKRKRNTCSIGGCDLRCVGHGWCSKHWTRWSRHGSPTARMPGEVVNGKRVCPKCGEDKALAEFGKDRHKPDGLQSRCRSCQRQLTAARRAANPDYRQPRRSPEVARKNAKRWRQRNPEKARAQAALRRASKRAADTERFSYGEIYERDQWKCQICGEAINREAQHPSPMSRSVDHRIPIARGGAHTRANCQAAHLRCNLRKHAKLVVPG